MPLQPANDLVRINAREFVSLLSLDAKRGGIRGRVTGPVI